MCKASRNITGLCNKSNGERFGCLSETKVLLIFFGRKNDSLRPNSNSEAQVMDDQRIESNEHYG